MLQFAVGQCPDTPSLWILENNVNAERLYRRMGFTKTGRINAITDELAEIEMALEQTDSSLSKNRDLASGFHCCDEENP